MHNTVTPALRQLFDDLADRRLFIVWDAAKVPIDPATGLPTDAQLEANRMLPAEALAWVQAGFGVGVGLVVTEDSGLFFLDLDHARQGESWLPYAVNFLSQFPGCYVEVSQSLEGLHVLGRTSQVPAHRTRNREYRLEFYTRARYCALTGVGAYGSIQTDATAAVQAFLGAYLQAGINDDVAPDWTTEPVEDWRGPADDEELLRRAMQAKSAAAVFGTGISFADIFTASPTYTAHYAADASGGDQALANYLAFWTGNNCERMLGLMKRSATARPKWDRADYLPRTILHACKSQKTWYREAVAQPIPSPVGDAAAIVATPVLSTPGPLGTPALSSATGAPGLPSEPADSSQIVPTVPGSLPAEALPYPDFQYAHDTLIKRFVFLRSDNKYYERATRTLIVSDALNKSEASRMPRKDDGSGGNYTATDLFDRSPLKVECVGEGYAPGYSDVYEEPGTKRKLVNTYHEPMYVHLEPTADERTAWAQYLQHLFPIGSQWLDTYLDGLAYLLRNPRGRLAYMSVLTGKKKGTGKSILMQAIPRLLFGIMNVSSPDAKAYESNFSDYLVHKRVVCFDELFAGNDRDEAEARMNNRSSWITDDNSLPVHPKGKPAYETLPNVVTFFGTSNYPGNAIYMPPDDRRYAIEETYASELPEFLKKQFGEAILSSPRGAGVMATLILERDISAFDPRRRPAKNAARVRAQQASLSSIQSELLAAWEDGDFYRDFDTLGNVRGILHARGIRNAPPDFRLSKELSEMFEAIGVRCEKYKNQIVISGTRVRVWIWRNHTTWTDATPPELSAAHSQFKMGQ